MGLPTLRRANEADHNQRLAWSLCRAVSETVEWRLPGARCGKVDALPVGYYLTVLLFFGVVVPFQRAGERGVFYGEGGTWYAITIRCPGAKVGYLTPFRAEGAPGIAFPGTGFVTEGAGHARIVARRIRESISSQLDGICCVVATCSNRCRRR